MFPILLTLLWDRQTKLAAIVSPLAGMVFGIATWLGLAYHFFGVLDIDSTGSSLSCIVSTRIYKPNKAHSSCATVRNDRVRRPSFADFDRS